MSMGTTNVDVTIDIYGTIDVYGFNRCVGTIDVYLYNISLSV